MMELMFHDLNIFKYKSLCVIPLDMEDFFFIAGVLLLKQVPGKGRFGVIAGLIGVDMVFDPGAECTPALSDGQSLHCKR